MDPFVGEIRLFAGTFAPRGWLVCNGQLLPIRQYTALFSLLGTTYGGDGTTTFALPNLIGRAAIHEGAGPGLTPRSLGAQVGEAATTLQTTQLPNHTHVTAAISATANSADPTGRIWANPGGRSQKIYSDKSDTPLNAGLVAPSGGGQPHNNLQPYLELNYIVAIEGVFPQRP